MKSGRLDYPFLIVTLLLAGTGFLIFSSAALGLLAREGASFATVAGTQVLFGIVCGLIALYITSRINVAFFRRFSLYLFGISWIAAWLPFVPGIGLALKGAHRWIEIGGFSFQPAELLKVGTILILASYFAAFAGKAHTLKNGLFPFLGIVAFAALPLAFQPDHDGILILVIAGAAIYFTAGGRFLHLFTLGLIGAVLAAAFIFARPYVLDRIQTFLDPSRDPLGSGYQVTQSMIAIGSGEVFGRGFGQSIQKFSHLPEPIGDSVFAVAGEEFGFVGATFLITLFVAFAAAGLRIAALSADRFGGLLAVGLVVHIISQSFINIASMLALFPLSGTPLIFVSHGGTALLIALAETGIILSVSRRLRAQ